MHISLDSALGQQRGLNQIGETISSIAAPTAAYSLRSLTGGDPKVVRVRRDSDNQEQDFTTSGVSSGALVDFVNEDVITEQSDFTSGVDGYARDSHGTVSREASFEGKSDVLKYVADAGRFGFKNLNVPLDYTSSYTISFEYYADSAFNNEVWGVGGAFSNAATAASNLPTVVSDAWTAVTLNVPSGRTGGSTKLFLRIQATGTPNYGTTSKGNVRVKNIVVTQLTGSGFVHTWYDQLGVNHATQGDSDDQPKIVNAGNFLNELDFDGTDDHLDLTSALGITSAGAVFTVAESGGGNDKIILDNRDGGSDGFRLFRFGDALEYRWESVTVDTDTNPGTDTKFLGFANHDGSNASAAVNGATATTVSDSSSVGVTATPTIGAKSFTPIGSFWDGTINELIIYNTDQNANRSALQTNINNHYSIF